MVQRDEVCPVCGGKTELFKPGAVPADDFFRRPSSYKVAAGDAKEHLTVVRCQRCGHGFTPHVPDEATILAWYRAAEQDESYVTTSVGRRKTARQVLYRIEALAPARGALADVGSGPGFFLAEAEARGWTVKGLEVANWAATFGREQLGLDIEQGDYKKLLTWPAQSLDVVCAFDVIEHLVSPIEFLRAGAQALKTDGWLVITTPWFDSPLARLMGKNWYCIFPAHLHYFTRESLTRLLEQAGFTVEHVHRHTRYLGWQYVWARFLAQLGVQLRAKTQSSSGFVVPVNLGDEFEIYAQKR